MHEQAMSISEQNRHLQKVSRTFALTIPLLPQPLADYVANAYLLCRIADTVEDDPKAAVPVKQAWLRDFGALAAQGFPEGKSLEDLSSRARAFLKEGAVASEYSLVCDMEKALSRTRGFPPETLKAISRGVAILSRGMAESLNGVKIACFADLDRYCYFVAGVVGELLAALFAQSDPGIDAEKLAALSVSFGEGLQLTNILKDRSQDLRRGVSYLPGDSADPDTVRDAAAVTLGHLENAMEFTRGLPRRSLGIRRFCLMNVCMAAATLKIICKDPEGDASALKITRAQVKRLYRLCSGAARFNLSSALLWRCLTRRLRKKTVDALALRAQVSVWDQDLKEFNRY